METYFADTYALFELTKGNVNFTMRTEGNEIITTRLNLMELYYWTILKKSKEIADGYYDFFLPRVVEFNDYTIKEAMKFRAENKEKNYSYIDSVGYQISLEKNMKFLTGDKAFEKLANVEYVK